jgi:Fic family protein
MLLGEAQSKCHHVGGVPLLPATAIRLHRLYLAKGALATTAIEGNTLSEEQVLAHLDGRLELPPSKHYLEREVANVIEAANSIGSRLLEGAEDRLTPDLLQRWNVAVLEGLPLEPDVAPGRWREHSVTAGRYLGAPAEDCPWLVERLCEWLNGFEPELWAGQPGETRIASALLRAVLAHLYLVWIHPFADGNGRTARLLEFHILVGAGLPSPAAHLLSNHYNETRAEYYRQLDAASRSSGGVLAFLEYALRGFVDGLAAQIETIREQQWAMTFEHFVDQHFAGRHSPPDLRQRDLVLDLGRREAIIAIDEIPLLTPRLARAYADRTRKTLTRDLNALVSEGLIERTAAGVRARREQVLAFLPARRSGGAGA